MMRIHLAASAPQVRCPPGKDSPWTKFAQLDTVRAMKRRSTMSRTRGALLPCLVLLVLAPSCGPPSGGAPTPDASGAVEEPGSHSAITLSGRAYMFRRALSREETRSARLQAQLDHRDQEIQRLEAELTRRREHEAQLQAELERVAHAAPAGAPEAPAAVAVPQSPPSSAAVAAALAAAERRHQQAEAESAGAIAGLRAALADEQVQRKRVETQLARLKEETSTPPYGPDPATQAALAAAKQEVVELRAELDKEHAAREQMAEEFRSLQERAAAERAAARTASVTSPELQTRLRELEEEKQNITRSFNRSLAESQQRTAELERQLAEARSAAPAATAPSENAVAAVRAENENLRSQLDEEHRRTEELAAKLRIATRVTDLIFKMQGQRVPSPPGSQR